MFVARTTTLFIYIQNILIKLSKMFSHVLAGKKDERDFFSNQDKVDQGNYKEGLKRLKL